MAHHTQDERRESTLRLFELIKEECQGGKTLTLEVTQALATVKLGCSDPKALEYLRKLNTLKMIKFDEDDGGVVGLRDA